MAALAAKLVIPSENGYRAWEDQTFIKWRKRDSHVPLRCQDSVEGTPYVYFVSLTNGVPENGFSLLIMEINWVLALCFFSSF